MRNILLAKRYAKALFDLAVEEGVIDRVSTDMILVAEVMAENRELRRMMTSPVIPPARKKLVIKKLFEGHLDKRTDAFLDILIRKGREEQVHDIAIEFKEMYYDYKNIALVEVTTASPIDDNLRQKLAGLMSTKTTKTIEVVEKTDADIIGGFILKLNDYQYNASMKKTIARLHKEFDENLYIKGF